MRLIDADKMAVEESEAYISAQCQIKDELLRSVNAVVHTKIQRLIADTPTVDAVEVVRCRDCLYYTPVDDNTGKCAFLIGEHQYVVPDGYCYLGELKEGVD